MHHVLTALLVPACKATTAADGVFFKQRPRRAAPPAGPWGGLETCRRTQDPVAAAAAAADEAAGERLFRLAAQYIALAAALQPGKEVYRRSLGVVRELLPRPALRAGALLAADPAAAGTCHERRAPAARPPAEARPARALGRAATPARPPAGGSAAGLWPTRMACAPRTSAAARPRPPPARRRGTGARPPGRADCRVLPRRAPDAARARRRVRLGDVAAVKACHDPSLPAGHAFWVALHSRPAGVYFVAGARRRAHAKSCMIRWWASVSAC